jgi:hypothetical protein
MHRLGRGRGFACVPDPRLIIYPESSIICAWLNTHENGQRHASKARRSWRFCLATPPKALALGPTAAEHRSLGDRQLSAENSHPHERDQTAEAERWFPVYVRVEVPPEYPVSINRSKRNICDKSMLKQ